MIFTNRFIRHWQFNVRLATTLQRNGSQRQKHLALALGFFCHRSVTGCRYASVIKRNVRFTTCVLVLRRPLVTAVGLGVVLSANLAVNTAYVWTQEIHSAIYVRYLHASANWLRSTASRSTRLYTRYLPHSQVHNDRTVPIITNGTEERITGKAGRGWEWWRWLKRSSVLKTMVWYNQLPHRRTGWHQP